MKELFTTVFDLIFPPGEELLVVRNMSPRVARTRYNERVVTDEVIALASFKDHQVRALIHEAKFHRNKRALELLGMLFTEFTKQQKSSGELYVPIPLSSKRLRERGYNQVSEILRYASVPTVEGILIRSKHTKPQTELLKEKRDANVRNAFKLAEPTALKGARVILVDDVVTTGATMREAKSVLLSAQPTSVTCVAIAH